MSLSGLGQFWEVAQPFVVGLVLFLIALLLRRIIYWILQGWTKEPRTDIFSTLIRVTKGASLLWCFLLGAYLAIRIGAAPSWEATADKILIGVGILSVILVIGNLAEVFIRRYAVKSKMAGAVSGLTQTVAKALIIGIGSLIILDNLGFNISSILAALGIGSLAIALGLQPTLANVFSGVSIILNGHINRNDFIKLDSGDQGYVIDIHWGNTMIRTLVNSTVIIPNSRLAGAIVTNHCLPKKNPVATVMVNVGVTADPERVEQFVLEAAKSAIGKVPGIPETSAPMVFFAPGLGPTSLGFTLICPVRDFTDQFVVEDELRKRVFKRLRAEGVPLPILPLPDIYRSK